MKKIILVVFSLLALLVVLSLPPPAESDVISGYTPDFEVSDQAHELVLVVESPHIFETPGGISYNGFLANLTATGTGVTSGSSFENYEGMSPRYGVYRKARYDVNIMEELKYLNHRVIESMKSHLNLSCHGNVQFANVPGGGIVQIVATPIYSYNTEVAIANNPANRPNEISGRALIAPVKTYYARSSGNNISLSGGNVIKDFVFLC